MDLIPGRVKKLWDLWDERIMIVLSLLFQIILIIFGSCRKNTKSTFIRSLVWSAYLLADWVATLTLGKLSHAGGDGTHDQNQTLQVRVLWAPLLLLHLGGPDAITAFALEDNQLWLRHLLGLVVQVLTAIYVILKFWRFHWFSFLSIPIFVSGILKYGERTCALYSASRSKQKVPIGLDGEETTRLLLAYPNDNETTSFVWAHRYIRIFKPQIANYVDITKKDVWNAKHLLQLGMHNVKLQWSTMEVEMGLMYDMLYTKAAKIYTLGGFIIRCITFPCTVASLLGFLLAFFLEPKFRRLTVDAVISGVLLVGAFLLEIYAVIVILSSNWRKLWLIKHRYACLFRNFHCPFSICKKKGWSCKIGQFNLFSVHLCGDNMAAMIGKILCCFESEEVDKWWHKTFLDVPENLDRLIIEFLFGQPSAPVIDGKSIQLDIFWKEENLKQWIIKNEYGRRIVIWHLATEICYRRTPNEPTDKRKICKCLSDYMMYLLIMCPSMIPVTTYRTDHTVEKAKILLRKQKISTMRQNHWNVFNEAKEGVSCASDFANYLENKEDKWEIMCFAWLEMLCYAAYTSQRKDHAQQLARGGELLTLVWLLITQSDIQDIYEHC